jgi:hypothetical protein
MSSHHRFIKLMLLASAFIFGCNDPHRQGAPFRPSIKKYFMHGDPATLIAGTTPDLQSFFTSSNYMEFNDFLFYGGAVYRVTSDITHQKVQQSIEEGQEATTDDQAENTRQLKSHSFEVTADRYRYSNGELTLCFVREGETLKLISAGDAGEDQSEVEVVHYSLKTDKSAFSLMVKLGPKDGGPAPLAVLYFVKAFQHAADLPEQGSGNFQFLLGPKTKAVFKKELRLFNFGGADRTLYARAASAWAAIDNDASNIGALNFTMVDGGTARPFSDLNQVAIFNIGKYLIGSREDSVTLGVTHAVINPTTQEIVGGAILISDEAHNKVIQNTKTRYPWMDSEDIARIRQQLLARTVTHEVGHLLGLDHEFRKDASGAALHPSVMSYDPKVLTIQDHDKRAITELYGVRKSEQ